MPKLMLTALFEFIPVISAYSPTILYPSFAGKVWEGEYAHEKEAFSIIGSRLNGTHAASAPALYSGTPLLTRN